MGGFSLWHWIILLFVLGVFASIVGLIIWLIVRVSRRPSTAASPSVSAPSQPSTESRLQELANLKTKGLITDSEHEDRRAAILQDV